MPKTSSVGRKVFVVMTTGILTAIGSGLVVFFAGLFSDVTQLKAQVVSFQEEKAYTEKRFDENRENFKEIRQMLKEIHYILIEKKRK